MSWINVYPGFPSKEDEQEVLPLWVMKKNTSYTIDGICLVQKNSNLTSIIDFKHAFSHGVADVFRFDFAFRVFSVCGVVWVSTCNFVA
jgi:hypothetical protein